MDNSSKIALAERQIAFVQEVLERTGWNQQKLCSQADINPSTLSVFMARKRPDHVLNQSTIAKIERASQISFDGRPLEGAYPKAPSSDDAEPFLPAHAPDLLVAIKALTEGKDELSVLTLRSNALVSAGYAPDDVLVCDARLTPREGDLVVAMSGAPDANRKRRVVRLFHAPYLVAAGTDPRNRWPIVVDTYSTSIVGVVRHQMRGRNRA